MENPHADNSDCSPFIGGVLFDFILNHYSSRQYTTVLHIIAYICTVCFKHAGNAILQRTFNEFTLMIVATWVHSL